MTSSAATVFNLPEGGLTTARLRLRPPMASDAPAIKEIMSTGEVTRWLTDIPSPFQDHHARDWVARCQHDWDLQAAYPFFAFANGALAGSITLTRINGDEAVVGFWLSRALWGKGLGVEMVGAISDWVFGQGLFLRLVAGVHPDNKRSITLLQKLGYMSIGERLYILPPHDHRAIGPHYMLTNDLWHAARRSNAKGR